MVSILTDPAPVRTASGLPGGARDDPSVDDRERSGAIVERGPYTFLKVRDPIKALVMFDCCHRDGFVDIFGRECHCDGLFYFIFLIYAQMELSIHIS